MEILLGQGSPPRQFRLQLQHFARAKDGSVPAAHSSMRMDAIHVPPAVLMGSTRTRKGEGDRRGAVGCRRAHDERPTTGPRGAFFVSEESWRRLSCWGRGGIRAFIWWSWGRRRREHVVSRSGRFPWTGLRFRANSAASSKAGVWPQLYMRREKGTEQAAAGDGEYSVWV
jgi:hypothetical protein